MSSCCNKSVSKREVEKQQCPKCSKVGKIVPIITLKSLLVPAALSNLNSEIEYFFCSTKDCDVVYYTSTQLNYNKSDLKVLVYQKDEQSNVPVCYCFGWTREKLKQGVISSDQPHLQIKEHVKAGRCGCEVNNPQGSCCLGNVTTYMKTIMN